MMMGIICGSHAWQLDRRTGEVVLQPEPGTTEHRFDLDDLEFIVLFLRSQADSLPLVDPPSDVIAAENIRPVPYPSKP